MTLIKHLLFATLLLPGDHWLSAQLTAPEIFSPGTYELINGVQVGGSFGNQKSKADLDGDGDIDVYMITGNAIRVCLNDGNGLFSPSTIVGWITDGRNIKAADLDGDGLPELVASAYDQTLSFANLGGGSFAPPTTLLPPSFFVDFVLADLDNDGALDVIHSSGPGIQWSRNLGDGTMAPPIVLFSLFRPNGLAVADLDNNGHIDILFSYVGTGCAAIMAYLDNQGDGTFSSRLISNAIKGPREMSVGDFNADGLSDVAFVASTSCFTTERMGSTGWIPQQPSGSFGPPVILDTTDISVRLLDVADFDLDGHLDMATSSLDNLQWFSNPGSGLAIKQVLDFPFNPDGLMAVDVDADGDQDIVHFENGTKLYRNRQIENLCKTPDSLKTTILDEHRILLEWSGSSKAIGYRVLLRKLTTDYRKFGATKKEFILFEGPLKSGIKYSWSVRAACASDSSAYAMPDTFTLPPLRRERESTLDLWPNPAADYVTLQWSGTVPLIQLHLLDAYGRTLRSWPGASLHIGRLSLPVSKLPTGLYFIRMHSADGVHVAPLIVE